MAMSCVRLDFADASDLNVEIDEERILRDGIEVDCLQSFWEQMNMDAYTKVTHSIFDSVGKLQFYSTKSVK